MKLMFVSSEFPGPANSTKAVFNEHLIRALARIHRVQVACPIPWTEELSAKRRGTWDPSVSERVTDSGAAVTYIRYWYPPKMLRSHYGSFYWWSVRGALGRLAQAQPPDVVLSYWAHPDGAAAVRFARAVGARSCVMVGGSDVLLLTKNPSRRELIGSALRAADFTLTVSQHLKERVVALGVQPEKVAIWERGVDSSLFSPGDRVLARQRLGIEPGPPVVLWVGRLVPVKGLEVLIDACVALRERGCRCRVYLVGDGPLRSPLEAAVAARGLQNTIQFMGGRAPDQLGDWYRAADVTALPSWSEGLPNVLRESAACGTPFVASGVGGIPEFAGRSDRLFPAGDASALADALAEALASPGARSEVRPLPNWRESAAKLTELLRPLAPAYPVPVWAGVRHSQIRTAPSLD